MGEAGGRVRGGSGRGRGSGWGGGRVCERRNEVFVKIQKINSWVGGAGMGSGGGGGQGTSEHRIEVFLKIQKKSGRGSGGSDWGVRLDVNEELKLL